MSFFEFKSSERAPYVYTTCRRNLYTKRRPHIKITTILLNEKKGERERRAETPATNLCESFVVDCVYFVQQNFRCQKSTKHLFVITTQWKTCGNDMRVCKHHFFSSLLVYVLLCIPVVKLCRVSGR